MLPFLLSIENVKKTELPRKAYNWQNILFLGGTHLTAFVGLPLYFLSQSANLFDPLFALVYHYLCSLGITVGYHRMLSHRAFKGGRVCRFLALFFGGATFETSALDWSSQHRDHHKYTDTDKDPYASSKGFFYSHIGWLLFWKHHINHSNCRDLQKSRLICHQHRYYYYWALFAGILVPFALCSTFGSLLGAVVFGVAGRIVLSYQATFCINSVCHKIGSRLYDAKSSARDHWISALLSCGEGYHNFHHRFPRDFRNGIRWYHFDPSKWIITLFAKIGLAKDLYRTPQFVILKEKLASKNLSFQERFQASHPLRVYEELKSNLQLKYENTLAQLQNWETAISHYKDFKKSCEDKTSKKLNSLKKELSRAKKNFKTAQKDWSLSLSETIRFCHQEFV